MSYFNEEQQDYMRYLASVPPERLCDCGWYERGDKTHKCYGKPRAETAKEEAPQSGSNARLTCGDESERGDGGKTL